ncbi:MAG: serine/threonine-protein phosphatase [Frankiaceae bacterium]|nr:serine/threonine-protein phosphatase [Frankiaceae bacterium]
MARAPARRRVLRPVSILALLVMLALTGAATWLVHVAVRDQEQRLLKERASEIQLLLTQAIDAIPAGLDEQGAALRYSRGSTVDYRQVAQRAVDTTQGAKPTFAWLRPAPDHHGFLVLAAVGDGLRQGQLVTDIRSATFDQALTTDLIVPTPIIGRERRLGFALGPPAAPKDTVLYREVALGPAVSPPRQASTAPFAELQVAIYGAATPDPSKILTSTSPHLPLRGEVRNIPLKAGAAQWLTQVKPRAPLVGSLAFRAPWVALGVGLLGALLVAFLVETAARRRDAALALYDAEHQVAETLQRSLLPQLPSLPGLDVAARYLASGAGQQVGGDWFDVFPVADGRVGLVVGDVIGHDLQAASAMAQIRASLRAYAIDGAEPVDVITRLDRLVDAFGLTQLVTVVYGVLEPPAPDGSRRLRYTNAGHLAPMLRHPDGRVETLNGGESVVLGAPITVDHTQGETVVADGAVIVMFTDGLVEVPGGSLDDRLRRLSDTIASEPDLGAETLCDRVLAGMSPQTLRDDIALLAVRIATPPGVPVDRAAATDMMGT